MTPAPREHEELYVLLDDLCDGALSVESAARLDALLRENPEARRQYLCYLQVHADLGLMAGSPAVGVRPVGAAVELPHQQAELRHELEAPNPEPLVPPIIIDTSPPAPAPLFSTLFAPGGWAFSYGVSAVIVGIAMLIGWAWRVSDDDHLATVNNSRELTAPGGQSAPPAPELAGRITGMADCEWADANAIPRGTAVSLGRKYALRSGMMEITYDSGAKVILQGPATYEVDSRTGGFLSLGKLTARVETKGEGGRRKAEGTDDQKSPFPLPPSSFVVRTPTAVVTDLGTEFGVEVDRSGISRTHVFRGRVRVQPTGGVNGDSGTVLLGADESACVEPVGDGTRTVRRVAVPPEKFTRLMPEPKPPLLLRDTFDNEAASSAYDDFGLNQSLSVRQSGMCRPVLYTVGGDYIGATYKAQVGHAVCRGKMNLFADYGDAGWVVLYRNFPPNITVAAELDPDALRVADLSEVPKTVPGDLTSENWIALGVRGRGLQFDNRELPLASDAGAVLMVRSNGKWGYFEYGTRIAEGRVPPAHPYHVVMRVSGDQLEIHVNGSELNLNPGNPGGAVVARTLHGLLAETKDNFICLGACNVDLAAPAGGRDINTVDNLTITQVPASPHVGAAGRPAPHPVDGHPSKPEKGDQPMNGP